MRRQTLLVVLAAAMLVLAGCGGAVPGGGTGGSGDDATDGGTATDDRTGTVRFYVSDQPTAISEFRHLNVTITRVGFERADGAAPNATATPADGSEDGTPDDDRAGWVTRDVDDRTVDLTRLQGDNATLVGTPEIPAGNYTKVFVRVERVDATLENGESANVKLPSGKLQLTKGFVLEPNGTVEFVYDISVVKAGNSGKYILKPVVDESGPGKEIEPVEREDEREGGESKDGENEREDGGNGGQAEGDPGQGN